MACVHYRFFFHFYCKSSKKMFKISNCTVQNKCTGEKFGPENIIIQYLIRIIQRGNLAKNNNCTCTIIWYPRVLSKKSMKNCHSMYYFLIIQPLAYMLKYNESKTRSKIDLLNQQNAAQEKW